MTTYDVESPPVSQHRKLPSSHISSTPILGTVMIRGDAALNGWATENTATEGCLFLTLGSGGARAPLCLPALQAGITRICQRTAGQRELLP